MSAREGGEKPGRPREGGGCVVSIHVGKAGSPLSSVDGVRAVPGRGLEGDRYFDGRGTWSRPGLWSEVTLVERAALDALRDAGVEVEDAGALRRNLVTEGVSLNALTGRLFRIGGAVLEGVRPCDPCGYLERLNRAPGLKSALAGRGGLRARIVKGGRLRVGDAVEPLGE